jgi:hypothetical protein
MSMDAKDGVEMASETARAMHPELCEKLVEWATGLSESYGRRLRVRCANVDALSLEVSLDGGWWPLYFDPRDPAEVHQFQYDCLSSFLDSQ